MTDIVDLDMSDQMFLKGESSPSIYVRKKRQIAPIFNTRPKRIWLVSFTDFISLMVAFFVMMYSTGDTQLSKFKEVSSAIGDYLNPISRIEQKSFQGAGGVMGASDVISLQKRSYKTGKDIKYLYEILNQRRQGISELASLETQLEGAVLTVSLPLADMLDPVRDMPTRESQIVVRELVGLLAGTMNRLELLVDWSGDFQNGTTQALMRGHRLRALLVEKGLSADIPILFNALSHSQNEGGLRATIRITRFSP